MSQQTQVATEQPAGIGGLSDTLIECIDLKEVEHFYTETLGLPVKARGDTWTVVDGHGGAIVLWQGEQSEIVVGFTGADLLPAREALEAQGAEPGPISKHPTGEYFYVTDPEGHKVMVST
jgi:catechol-2,3-dioxygenase